MSVMRYVLGNMLGFHCSHSQVSMVGADRHDELILLDKYKSIPA